MREVTVHKEEDEVETFSFDPVVQSNPGFDFYATDSNDISLG